jgi:hypothetical protein
LDDETPLALVNKACMLELRKESRKICTAHNLVKLARAA